MSLVRVAGLCELNAALRRKKSDQAEQLQNLLTFNTVADRDAWAKALTQ